MLTVKIQCKICKKYYRQLGSHIYQTHEMTAQDYKVLYGLDVSKGLLTDDLKELKARKAKENNTYKNLEKGAKYRFAKKHKINYVRSSETMERLKKHFARVRVASGKPATVEKILIHCANTDCKKDKLIYPRYYKQNNNYCSILCRNIANNKKRYETNSQ